MATAPAGVPGLTRRNREFRLSLELAPDASRIHMRQEVYPVPKHLIPARKSEGPGWRSGAPAKEVYCDEARSSA